jgi:hypothetical protein
VEGRNVAVELYATEQYDRLPPLASELVRRQVAVIYASTLPAALAAKTATGTIPIVFSIGGDPIEARRHARSVKRSSLSRLAARAISFQRSQCLFSSVPVHSSSATIRP